MNRTNSVPWLYSRKSNLLEHNEQHPNIEVDANYRMNLEMEDVGDSHQFRRGKYIHRFLYRIQYATQSCAC